MNCTLRQPTKKPKKPVINVQCRNRNGKLARDQATQSILDRVSFLRFYAVGIPLEDHTNAP